MTFFDGLLGSLNLLIEPKHEDSLPLDTRIANRIRVNDYILLRLPKRTES